jgi:hypothetical protein
MSPIASMLDRAAQFRFYVNTASCIWFIILVFDIPLRTGVFYTGLIINEGVYTKLKMEEVKY